MGTVTTLVTDGAVASVTDSCGSVTVLMTAGMEAAAPGGF